MAITFNTNLSALTSQRYLGVASDKTASSLAKLSSGSRVPTAKDDAAALAVGSKLRAEVAGLNTAANNASQAVSLLQIADGALSTVSDILVRMKALAVQSSSGQLADAERGLLNQEYNNLLTEIDRIAQVTNFNGNTLLNGGDVVASATEAKPGSLDGRGIALKFNTAELGSDEVFRVSYAFTDGTTTGDSNAEVDSGRLTVTNLTTGESQTIDIAAALRAATGEAADVHTDGTVDLVLSEALDAGKTLDINFNSMGVTLTLDNRFNPVTSFNGDLTGLATSAGGGEVTGTVAANYLQGSGTSGANFATLFGTPATYNRTTGALTIQMANTTTANTIEVQATTGLEFSLDGVSFGTSIAAVNINTNDHIYVRAGNAGQGFMRLDLSGLAQATTGTNEIDVTVNLDGMFRAEESVSAVKSFDFKVGTGVTVNDNISFTLSAGTSSALNISGSSIATVGGANDAIVRLNDAINTVASRRADIGANQSRLDFAAAGIAVAVENTTAAQSGLMDVDVSAEITEFTSQQVLLQAGVSLLAQANQQPALLLRLLQ